MVLLPPKLHPSLTYDSMTTTFQQIQELGSLDKQPNTQKAMEGPQPDHTHPERCAPNSPGNASATTPRLSLQQIPSELSTPSPDYTQDTSPWCSPPSDSAYSSGLKESQNGTLSLQNPSDSIYMGPAGTHALSNSDKPLSQHLMGFSGMKRELEPTQLETLDTDTRSISLQGPTLDAYISSYWQYFNPLWPIIHRATFDPTEDNLLSSAMAAIGTQYHSTPDVRSKGSELNETCRKGIELVRIFWAQCIPITNNSSVPKSESACNAGNIPH